MVLAACSPNGASHLPNPVLLPGMAVGTALENTVYNARRSRVKTFVSENFDAILEEIERQDGPYLDEAYDLAKVPTSDRPALTRMLKDDPRLRKDAEALIVSLMVHGT